MTSGATFNPFPGLRPFRESESHLFFGRSRQVDELLAELGRSRFVAVLGASGSGKSSLVKAGLLPALHGGFSLRVGSHWRVATFRPGGNPIHNLARALVGPDVLGAEGDDPVLEAARVEAVLRRSRLGLADAVAADSRLDRGRLLVVVDQFEELFRYDSTAEHADAPTDAASFVRLLVEASRADAPVDVIVTMRSDFLGDCSQFRELPETINDGLYLVPRLTRSQLHEAITGPVAVGGAAMTPRLVQRLLNDAGSDPDTLPVLQHAMMRTWDIWADGEATTRAIDLEHYEASGGLSDALARHADEAFHGLDDGRTRHVAEVAFKRLTELGPDGREVRRPSPLAEIAAVAEATPDEVGEILSEFVGHGRSFVHVSADGVVDISHESLIRQWPRLREWVRQEASSRDLYRRLAGTASRWERGEAALLRDPDLQLAVAWWDANRPNQAWAERYDPAFERASAYLDSSRSAARRRRRLAMAGVALLAILTVVSAVSAIVAVRQRNRAETATATAERQERIAVAGKLAALSISQGRESRVPSILTALEALRATEADGLRVPGAEEALRIALQDPLGTRLPGQPEQIGHDGPVSAVAFSPDGSVLATGSDDWTVLLWSVDDPGAAPAALVGHESGVTALAFSSDGSRLATGSFDGTARLWDPSTLDGEELVGHDGAVTAVAFSPDGRWLATAGVDTTARLWDLADPALASTSLEGHDGFVLALAFDPDGTRLVTGSGDETAQVWSLDDVDAGPLTLRGHDDDVVAVAVSPDGRFAATASDDGTAKVWDLDDPSAPTATLDHRGAVVAVAFSPDGRRLATGSRDRSARLWDLQDPEGPAANPLLLRHLDVVTAVAFDESGDRLATASLDNTARLFRLDDPRADPVVLAGHEGQVNALAFDPDGRWLASGSGDGAARLWDLDDLSTRPAVLRHTVVGEGYSRADVATVAFSPTGDTLATGTSDKTAWLWPLDAPGSGPVLLEHEAVEGFGQAGVTALAYSPDGRQLATGSGDRTIRLWDLDSPGTRPTALEADDLVTAVAFSPDGRHLAGATQGEAVSLWDLDTLATAPTRLAGHTDQVTSLAFSPDGRWLATGSRDATVVLWAVDEPDAEPVAEHLLTHDDFVTTLAFRPDGGALATGSRDRTVRLWALDAGTPAVEHELGHDAPLTGLAYSPDGALLVATDTDSVLLWDLVTPDPTDPIANPVVLRGHAGPVTGAAFSADGRHFATVGGDETARVWPVLAGLVDLGCRSAGRNLTQDEWQAFLPGEPYRTTCEQWPAGP